MKYDYAFEKLMATIDILATNKGRIKKRLFDAVLSQFINLTSDKITNYLPSNLQKKYDIIISILTKEKAIANEGSLEATIKKLSEEEAKKIAEDIFSLFFNFLVDYYK